MTGEDGTRLLLKRKGRVTKEGDGAAELACSNAEGGRDGEGGTTTPFAHSAFAGIKIKGPRGQALFRPALYVGKTGPYRSSLKTSRPKSSNYKKSTNALNTTCRQVIK